MPTLDSQSRIRWLPAAIIVVLTILAIILLWSLDATTATMAGSSYSIGLDAFVSVDTAVAAPFLTAEVESPGYLRLGRLF